jgi:hypothetical protein
MDTKTDGHNIPIRDLPNHDRLPSVWYLIKPAWPAVGSEFLNHYAFWDNMPKLVDGMTTIPECLIMMHLSPREYTDLYTPGDYDYIPSINPYASMIGPYKEREDEPLSDVTNAFEFPCCACGTCCQLVEIPRIVYAAWLAEYTEYPLVLAATLSAYVSQKAYESMRARLNDINAELVTLHKAMIHRKEMRSRGSIENQLDAYKEGPVLSMLEKLYGYVEHGGSIGGCWLCLFDTPYFI